MWLLQGGAPFRGLMLKGCLSLKIHLPVWKHSSKYLLEEVRWSQGVWIQANADWNKCQSVPGLGSEPRGKSSGMPPSYLHKRGMFGWEQQKGKRRPWGSGAGWAEIAWVVEKWTYFELTDVFLCSLNFPPATLHFSWQRLLSWRGFSIVAEAAASRWMPPCRTDCSPHSILNATSFAM